MMHERRAWTIAPAASPEDLAHKLTEHTWTCNTGFELGGYLFLNDSTGPDGAQEYGVVKRPTQAGGSFLQVESITFSWCNYEKALSYVHCAIKGGYDSMEYVREVEPEIEPAFQTLGQYVECLKSPTYLKTSEVLPLPEHDENDEEQIARISQTGRVAEVTEETYWYFLEVLPPKWLQGSTFCFAEGEVAPCIFWQTGERYFARQLGDDEWKTFLDVASRQPQVRDRDHEPTR